MKTQIVPWLVWVIVLFAVQTGTMYLLLRVLEYRFFASDIVATTLAVALAYLARRFVHKRDQF
jgi:hypothetical protein